MWLLNFVALGDLLNIRQFFFVEVAYVALVKFSSRELHSISLSGDEIGSLIESFWMWIFSDSEGFLKERVHFDETGWDLIGFDRFLQFYGFNFV